MADSHMLLPPPTYEAYAIPEVYQVNETVQVWINQWLNARIVSVDLTENVYDLLTYPDIYSF